MAFKIRNPYPKMGTVATTRKGKINKNEWFNRTGLWEGYNRNGKLSYRGEYQDGSKIGNQLFYDEGCFYPETTFNFKNINRKTTESYKNNSFETHNIIFNESELLNDMTFFEIQHCEGTRSRITTIYK